MRRYNDKGDRVNGEREFPAWRRPKLGIHKGPADLARALEDGGFHIGKPATEIPARVALAPTPTEIELVNVALRDLGFGPNVSHSLQSGAAESRMQPPRGTVLF